VIGCFLAAARDWCALAPLSPKQCNPSPSSLPLRSTYFQIIFPPVSVKPKPQLPCFKYGFLVSVTFRSDSRFRCRADTRGHTTRLLLSPNDRGLNSSKLPMFVGAETSTSCCTPCCNLLPKYPYSWSHAETIANLLLQPGSRVPLLFVVVVAET